MKAGELRRSVGGRCGEVVVGGDWVNVGVGEEEVGAGELNELRREVNNAPSSSARQQSCLHEVVRSVSRIIG